VDVLADYLAERHLTSSTSSASSGSPHEPSSPPGSAARTQTEVPCSCSLATRVPGVSRHSPSL
jgi:hypothetical protein